MGLGSYHLGVIENLVLGIVSGVISGLIVALLFWLHSFLSKPPLELFHVGHERAVLRNNRLRAVVIGGSWELCNGSVLYRPDGFRGGTGGFYIEPLGQIVVGTKNFAPGQTADLAVKYVRQVDDGVERHRLEESCIVEPTEILSHPEKYPDWDLLRVLHKGVR